MLAACIFATIPLLAALAGPAAANSGNARQSGGKLPVSLAITSVSAAYATPGQTLTVRGSVTNTSPAAISGMTVRLRSSNVSFSSRDALQEYADGNEPLADGYIEGAIMQLTTRLAPGATADWKIRLPVAHVRMTKFGVYPLAAEADGASGAALAGGTSRTFLPFWPRKHGPDPRPVRQDIAWIWPVIDQPRQGACPGFPDNSLEASLAPGGRLDSLLTAGAAESASAQLTWAIDPSLLAGVEAMSKGPYRVGSNADCKHGHQMPASHAAATWRAGLLAATSGQPVFVTPYADVDIAALTRVSLDQDLAAAFTEGRSVASKDLRRDFSLPAAEQGSPAAAQPLDAMAWPADGLANHSVLENLAVNKITAVVLDSTMMPPSSAEPSFTPASAIASTPDGVNGDMRVLLSDDTITQILGTADAPSDPPATAFAVEQRFLAETAMIAAQGPNSSRAIVVAPPRRWDPPAGLAKGLLTETVSAPWLKPASLGSLAAAKPAPAPANLQPPAGSAKADLSRRLLRKVKILDRRVTLLQSTRLHPDPQLNRAVAAVESSAWRGRVSSAQAQILLTRLSDYITSQQSAVTIIAPLPVTLGGLTGTVPVSISNRLDYAVHVRLKVSVPSDGRFTSSPSPLETIAAQQVMNVKLKMRSSSTGSTTVILSLLTPGGQALPGKPVAMTIRATHFGTLALVILAAALGVFMISSAARAIRQGHVVPPRPGPAGSDATAADSAERPEDAVAADSVVADHADQRTADQRTADHAGTAGYHDPTEDTDEFARAPGWADQG